MNRDRRTEKETRLKKEDRETSTEKEKETKADVERDSNRDETRDEDGNNNNNNAARGRESAKVLPSTLLFPPLSSSFLLFPPLSSSPFSSKLAQFSFFGGVPYFVPMDSVPSGWL